MVTTSAASCAEAANEPPISIRASSPVVIFFMDRFCDNSFAKIVINVGLAKKALISCGDNVYLSTIMLPIINFRNDGRRLRS